MGWQQAYDARDDTCKEQALDDLEQLVGPEQIRLVATPFFVNDHSGWDLGRPFGLFVTESRVILGGKKKFGGIKISWERPISEFRRASVEMSGRTNLYELNAELNRGRITFMFQTSDAAEAVENILNLT